MEQLITSNLTNLYPPLRIPEIRTLCWGQKPSWQTISSSSCACYTPSETSTQSFEQITEQLITSNWTNLHPRLWLPETRTLCRRQKTFLTNNLQFISWFLYSKWNLDATFCTDHGITHHLKLDELTPSPPEPWNGTSNDITCPSLSLYERNSSESPCSNCESFLFLSTAAYNIVLELVEDLVLDGPVKEV